MMNEAVVLKASYMTPEGYGSSVFGNKEWPENGEKQSAGKDLMGVSWSSLFSSSCSRFGRMSPLCRLGLMTVELLDAGFADMSDEEKREIGVCMVSNYGTISTDMSFLQNISPSIFVYTLPSNVIGEVCIRHRLMGPSLCLMSEGDSRRGIIEEASERIAMCEASAMLCLLCDARTPDTQGIPKSELDKNMDFCWYAYAVYLVRKGLAHGKGNTIPHGSVGSAADIRRICLDLCENGRTCRKRGDG